MPALPAPDQPRGRRGGRGARGRAGAGGVAEPERLGTTALPDGRRLGWAEWGPQDGAPVLLCPGAGTSRRLGFAAGALAGLGVRLVSADRPGLGASDPAPGRTLLDWPRDVAALAEDRGLDELSVVGFSQGAPFALACAAAGTARAAAVVSGTDELSQPAFAGALDPQLRAAVDEAREDPAAAEATFAGLDASTLHGMIVGFSGEEDRAVYADPSFEPLFRAALEEAFARGPAGYARDTLLAMSPWPFAAEDIRVPVHLWYGARDESPVHSPDLGDTLARRIPRARRRVVEDAGGALLWTHGAEILRALLG